MKIFRILGKYGRITIPLAIRQKLKFKYNDVLSFEDRNGVVVIRNEKICSKCKDSMAHDKAALQEFLNGLTDEEQRSALVYLSVLWAEKGRHV